MGQRTLAFTKQMLKMFRLVELEEFDLLVVDSSKLGNGSQSIRDTQRIQTCTSKHILA
jgi:hypothetical protein